MSTNPIVTIEMENGDIMKAELYPEVAPVTVANFVKLVQEGFYDGLIFHRVIPGFMIQGGDPEGTGMGGSAETIKGEFSANGVQNELKHTKGVLSMARTQMPNSASSQFFIMADDSPHLDGSYAAFGKVIEGIEAVDKIVTAKRDRRDKPLEDQRMKKVTVSAVGTGIFKYGFIMLSDTYTPENYQGTIKDESFLTYTCAVNSLEMACAMAKELAEQGFECIELCGDFDDEMTAQIKKCTGENVKVRHAWFTDEAAAAFEALENISPYGFMFHEESADPAVHTLTLKGGEFDTVMTAVASVEQAVTEAKRMIKEDGVKFIELCGWFDMEKLAQIQSAAGPGVPVGTAFVK